MEQRQRNRTNMTPSRRTQTSSHLPEQKTPHPYIGGQGRPSLFKIPTSEDGGLTTQPKPHISDDICLATKSAALFAAHGTHNQEHDWKLLPIFRARVRIRSSSQSQLREEEVRDLIMTCASDSNTTSCKCKFLARAHPSRTARASTISTEDA
ncbi:hypothetical protein EV1_009175 [Malus domestica]